MYVAFLHRLDATKARVLADVILRPGAPEKRIEIAVMVPRLPVVGRCDPGKDGLEHGQRVGDHRCRRPATIECQAVLCREALPLRTPGNVEQDASAAALVV